MRFQGTGHKYTYRLIETALPKETNQNRKEKGNPSILKGLNTLENTRWSVANFAPTFHEHETLHRRHVGQGSAPVTAGVCEIGGRLFLSHRLPCSFEGTTTYLAKECAVKVTVKGQSTVLMEMSRSISSRFCSWLLTVARIR